MISKVMPFAGSFVGYPNGGLPQRPPLNHLTTVPASGLRVHLMDRWHPQRAQVEAFIATVFSEHYGAQLTTFHDTLIGCNDDQGDWVAALGFSSLAHRPAFLEQYLDQPVEQMIGALATPNTPSSTVLRRDIVEVGNLAALRPGATRALISGMTDYLHGRHFRWVVFTATQSLANSFSKLGFRPVVLAEADSERLGKDQARWGTYYHHSPRVMAGDIHSAYA